MWNKFNKIVKNSRTNNNLNKIAKKRSKNTKKVIILDIFKYIFQNAVDVLKAGSYHFPAEWLFLLQLVIMKPY